MKSVYWRPKKVAASTTMLIGVGAALILAAIELAPRFSTPTHKSEKLAANQLAHRCQKQIRHFRREKGMKINALFDPNRTGLVGMAMSSITSKPANLEAKQCSLHPQFPSAVVQMLRDAGVENGDTVAVGWTGSFPGLNLALAAAMESMNLRPIIVASVTASQYGANEPELTWLDMETELRDAGLIECRSLAATIGGPADCGVGMDESSLLATQSAIDRSGAEFLAPRRVSDSVRRRMKFIRSHCALGRVSAYVNVGGGVASCGGSDSVFRSGVTYEASQTPAAEGVAPDCVMQRFVDRGTPVVHLAHAVTLAEKFGLSTTAESWQVESVVGDRSGPSRVAAFGAFAAICGLLSVFVLKDTGNQQVARILSYLKRRPALRAVGQLEGPQLMA